MQLLLPAAYTAVFIYVIYKFRFFGCEGLSRKLIAFIFLLKIVFGTALWAIYTYYYTDRSTADIYKYFDDGRIIYEAIKTNPEDYFRILFGIGNDNAYFDANYYYKMNFWSKSSGVFLYNESHTIIRFNAFAFLFSLGNYHVHTVIICFLSLTGLTAIYKTFAGSMADKKKELAVIVFFIPSLLLWGSGVLKEGLLVFSLGIVLYSMKLIINRGANKILLLSFLTLSLYLLLLTKFYAIAAIIPSLIAWLWCHFSGNRHVALKFLSVHILYIAYILRLDHINDFYDLPQLLALKQQDFFRLAKEQNANSLMNSPVLEPTAGSILSNMPIALFNAVFRPHLLEARSPLVLLAAIENLIIILFVILSICFGSTKHIKNTPTFYLALSFSVLMLIVIGLTTPIAGALVRYRSVALPFFLIIFLFIYDKEKLTNKFPVLKKYFFFK